jgi:hypothetical protein
MTSLTTPGDAHAVVAAELLDDRYHLITLLHRAGDTETWQAHDARLNRAVIVELMPPMAALPELLSQRYSDRVPVYDAGSHTWRGDPGTYVVTTLRLDAKPASYRPRHSLRESFDEQPLSVGDWQVPTRSRRTPRSRRGRLSAADR